MSGRAVDAAVRFAIADLYADYAAHLDERRYEQWLALFDEDCRYTVQPRENADAGLPLATVRLESKGMLKDRVHAVTETMYHGPYYQRHIIGPASIAMCAEDEARVEANYLVIRTHLGQPSDVFNTGRYIDRLTRTPEGWRIRDKLAVFDSELIPNSMIYPI